MKVASLETANVCPSSPPSIDYSSNAAVSSSLKAWPEETHGTISTAEWEVVWNNSKTSIHKLTGEYQWVYLVYFDDAALNNKDSVFDLQGTCWLDR